MSRRRGVTVAGYSDIKTKTGDSDDKRIVADQISRRQANQ